MARESAVQDTPKAPPGRAYEILTPGEKFDDYQILRCVAYDILGSLYEIEHIRDGSKRSIYVLPPIVRGDNTFRNRFREYSEPITDLEHPNIFSFERGLVLNDRFCFLGAPFEGRNLVDHLEDHVHALNASKASAQLLIEEEKVATADNEELLGDQATGLPLDEVHNILGQILEALRYAHRHNVVHLNLNPTNLLRSKDGAIKVVGFGLMTMAGKQLYETLVSAGIPPISIGPRRIRINTVDILSPEARLGQAKDQRSDIYALGITAYWLLTGRKPKSNYQPASELRPEIGSGWDTLISNCLERDPDKRYQSAAAVLRDLANIETLSPPKPTPVAPGPSETGTIFRHIGFIPVPQKIRQRGIVYERAFRLFIIGLFGVVGMGLASTFYLLAFSEETALSSTVAIRTPAGQTPRLSMTISPENARVTIRGEDMSFLVRDGTLNLNIRPGTYNFEIDAPNFLTEKRLVQIERTPVELNVKLRTSYGHFRATGLPGTEIIATDSAGRTFTLPPIGENGVLDLPRTLYSGNYAVRASLPNHAPKEIPAMKLANEGVTEVDLELTPLPAYLAVTSNPIGAVIRDGEGTELGRTPALLGGDEALPLDTDLTVSIEAEGFASEQRTIRLHPGQEATIDFGTLRPLSGGLDVAVDFAAPRGAVDQRERDRANITITALDPVVAERQRLLNEMGLTSVRPVGHYRVRVEHPNFHSSEQTVEIKPGQANRIRVTLEPKPATLVLNVVPDSVEATVISGDRQVSTIPGRSTRIELPPFVEHEVQISARDHFTMKTEVQLGANESTILRVALQPVPGPQPDSTYTIPYLNMELNWIPSGSFTMGSPESETARLPNEGPVTGVTLSKGFWMGRYEVTQKEYQAVMGTNPSRFKGENRPVESVTWRDAMSFAARLNQMEGEAGRLPVGYQYRLPTEAEWEYAARAGTTTPFHFGATAGPHQANFRGRYPRDLSGQTPDEAVVGTAPVGQYEPNNFGLYDMHGNVREWCLDWYHARLPGGSQRDPVGPRPNVSHFQEEERARKSYRGGSYEDRAHNSRVASRGEGLRPYTPSPSTGFRIVLGPIVDGLD